MADLTPDALIDDPARFVIDGRDTHYRVCPDCGAVGWESYRPSDAPRAVFAWMDEYGPGCGRCAEVAHWAPEIGAWVLAVATIAARRAVLAAKEVSDAD